MRRLPREAAGEVCLLPRRVNHPSTVTHLRGCRQCKELLGLALTRVPVGRCVVRLKLAGAAGVEVREVAGLYWVLKGDRVEEVTQNYQEALSVGDRLSAEALTPEPSPVRVALGPDGMFRARQGCEVVARARNAKKLRAALGAAEPSIPEGWWTRYG